MSSKQNPSVYNCYKAALPDEPVFTILGRDPAGPATLEFWVSQRIKLGKTVEDDDKDRIRVAFDDAKEMQEWRDKMLDASVDGIPPWRLPVHFIGEAEEPHPDLPDRERFVPVEEAALDAAKRDERSVRLLATMQAALREVGKATGGTRDPWLALSEIERILTAGLDGVRPEIEQDDPLRARLDHVVQTLRDGRLPAPYNLYRAVKNDEEGAGWHYEALDIGAADLHDLLYRISTAAPVAEDPPVAESIPAKPPVIDSEPNDLAHAPEVPHHRFSTFHKAGDYGYARGLEVNPMHLPVALDAMSRSGWHLLAIFGQTDSQHIGFIFRRQPEAIFVPSFWTDDKAEPVPSKALELYQQGAPFAEIVEAATAETNACGADGRGRGLEP